MKNKIFVVVVASLLCSSALDAASKVIGASRYVRKCERLIKRQNDVHKSLLLAVNAGDVRCVGFLLTRFEHLLTIDSIRDALVIIDEIEEKVFEYSEELDIVRALLIKHMQSLR